MESTFSAHQKRFKKLALPLLKRLGGKIRILIIAGPSWTWKTTLIRALLKKFPKEFSIVTQISTRPPHKNILARKYVPLSQFSKESIVLEWISGKYPCWYGLSELLSSIKEGKITIFESIARFEKFQMILWKEVILWVTVGILPPWKTIPKMIQELRRRLIEREDSQEDIEEKMFDAASRIIPWILKKADIIIRSANYQTDSDIEKIMKILKKKIL